MATAAILLRNIQYTVYGHKNKPQLLLISKSALTGEVKGYNLFSMDTVKTIPVKPPPLPTDAFEAVRHMGRPFILAGGLAVGQRRYSYVGAAPVMAFESTRTGSVLIKPDGREEFGPDPFKALSEIFSTHGAAPGPFPFSGGAVGYFSYELKDVLEPHLEPRLAAGTPRAGEALPLSSFAFYDTIYVYDHLEGTGVLARRGEERTSEGMREALASFGTGPVPGPGTGPGAGLKESLEPPSAVWSSDFTKNEYIETVVKAKEYIAAGDIYQINLSQRLSVPYTGDPFALFKALASKSPAPFSSFIDTGIDTGGIQIISNTPERLMKVDGTQVETSPIKGTRPRGSTAKEDAALMEELKRSPKERAEHVMIVDLERSDLGRVSATGTVEVTEFGRVVTYPGLHHMVSTIKGNLQPGIDSLLALRECFPGGSITGAPKIRAMEIIEELERSPRGVYTGAVGYIDFSGVMDMAMAIRTAVLSGGVLTLPVGGAVVADSVPADEYDETLLKAGAFKRLLAAATGATITEAGR